MLAKEIVDRLTKQLNVGDLVIVSFAEDSLSITGDICELHQFEKMPRVYSLWDKDEILIKKFILVQPTHEEAERMRINYDEEIYIASNIQVVT